MKPNIRNGWYQMDGNRLNLYEKGEVTNNSIVFERDKISAISSQDATVEYNSNGRMTTMSILKGDCETKFVFEEGSDFPIAIFNFMCDKYRKRSLSGYSYDSKSDPQIKFYGPPISMEDAKQTRLIIQEFSKIPPIEPFHIRKLYQQFVWYMKFHQRSKM